MKRLLAVVAILFSISAIAQPNLTPYQPGGWSDKIVVSTGSGTSADSSPLYTTNTLYVDWAVANFGTAAGAFNTSLYVDGSLKNSWSAGSIAGSSYIYIQDYSIGSLSAGSHTIQVVADSGGAISESNEGDNSYTKTINVTAVTLLAPTLSAPANNSVGLSTTPSFSWSTVAGATSYRIMVATNAADLPTDPNASTGGASLVINTTSATTSYTPTVPINPGTTYYWQVHGRGGSADIGNWSAVNSFTTAAGGTGLTIIPTFDSSITSDAQSASIQSTINAAIAVYASKFSDPITVAIKFVKMSSGLGSSSSYYTTISYSSYRNALSSHSVTVDDSTALTFLPSSSTNPVNGSTTMNVNLPLVRALGFSANPPGSEPDGTVYLNISSMNVSGAQTDSSKYALFSVVSHEIDEVLGFSSALNGLTNGAPAPTGSIGPEDLFRYNAVGARSFTSDSSATSYFSLDGTTQIARFNQSQTGDFQDWYSPSGTPQVQDAFGTPGSSPVLGTELRVLDVIGYTPAGSQVTITASAGAGGSISPNGAITKGLGSSQSFTATTNVNYFVNQWLLDGGLVQTGGTNYTLSNIQTNHTVQVTFSPRTNQTISFGALGSKVYGDAPFGVSATASSGLPVSFSIFSGPATLSGTNVTIIGTGTVVVRASQAGNVNFNPAANVDQSFTVTAANQTITFGTLGNKVYGDPSFGVSATASSGLLVSFSIFSGPATISGTNVTITGAGTVVVRASQGGNTNYNSATNVNQSFTVAKANQTIAFGSLPNRAVGEPAFGLTATASSGLPVSFSIFSGLATISGTNVTITGAGAVVVRASQGGNTNYNASPNIDQSFTAYAQPTMTLTTSGTNIIVAWPTNVPGFALFGASNLVTGALWTSVVPSPAVVAGQYVVTNTVFGPAKFYRLKK